MELKHCFPQKYGSAGTFEEAKSSCTSDENCAAIYDNGCTGDGFTFCPNGFEQKKSSVSCLYIKSGKPYCIFLVRIVTIIINLITIFS